MPASLSGRSAGQTIRPNRKEIWILVVILGDVFRRRDIGGWAKAAWCVFLIVLPFIGVLTYLIAQHDGMAQRSTQAEFDALKAKALAGAH
jgi:hypothetical protein